MTACEAGGDESGFGKVKSVNDIEDCVRAHFSEDLSDKQETKLHSLISELIVEYEFTCRKDYDKIMKKMRKKYRVKF